MKSGLELRYIELINEILPATYTYPVRFNHCFNRIILDWLFCDCWYHHLSRGKTARSQLTPEQLQQAIGRMEAWLKDHKLLVSDNHASLRYRQG